MRSIHALAAVSAACFATSAMATVVISDDFEVDSSANYTVVNDGTPDGTQAWAFDYIAAGIPLAPRSAAADKGAVRLTANDTAGATDAWTLFHNTPVSGPQYRLLVDVYIGFSGTAGTTEYAQVGVGGNGTTFNSIFTPISGSGAFHAFTGDGGSASDHRWYLDPANGGPTTVAGSDPSYLAGSANGTAALYQSIFPSPPATVAGSPGNIWTTVEFLVDNNTLTISYDGIAVIQSGFTGSLDGLVSIGINDPFTSVDPGTVFVLFDNLTVELVPEPATLGLIAAGALLALRRR